MVSLVVWHINRWKKERKKVDSSSIDHFAFSNQKTELKHCIQIVPSFYETNMQNIVLAKICNLQYKIFISDARLKFPKNQTNAKQHPKAELLLFENYSHSSSTLSFKNNRTYSKKKKENKCFCIHEIIRLIINWRWRWKWNIDHRDTT